MSTSYSVRHDVNVLVAMDDGVRLSINVTRPDAPGKFPAIIEFVPYRIYRGAAPIPHYKWFAGRGYALIQYDVRGTGNSEGFSTDVYSPEERADSVEMIHWVASQPWCDGNVGMWGISYGAVVSVQAAAAAPEPLKAIIVRSGNDDVYSEWTNPGGCPRPYMYMNYAPLMAAYNFAPPDPALGPQWECMWEERKAKSRPWGLGFISNLKDGPFWRERSLRPDYSRVRCAVYVIEGWADWYFTTELRMFANLPHVPRKALIGPWSHEWMNDALPGPRIDGWHECLRWWDRHLKGIDNGIDREPPVTLFVREFAPPRAFYVEDTGFWRNEDAWPPARVVQMPMYLHADRTLSGEPPKSDASQTFDYDPTVGVTTGVHGAGPFPPFGMPIDQRADEAVSLCFTSAPLERDLELIGDCEAVLHVSSTAPVAYFHVKLCDVAPDGMSMLVSRGGLNATHRASHSNPELIEPGHVYELRFTLLSAAHRFRAGHRIRVSIAGGDFQNAWPTPHAARHTVYLGDGRASHVVVPVAPPQNPPLPEPKLLPSDLPLPRPEDVKLPEYQTVLDPVRKTMAFRWTTPCGAGINRGSFTVSSENPANAAVEATYEMTCPIPGGSVVMKCDSSTRSDAYAFHYRETVEAIVGGKTRFKKSWERSLRRVTE